MTDNIEGRMVGIMESLAAPFPTGVVYWKPQTMAKDDRRGLAVPYADPRAYLDRLNETVPGEWHSRATFTVAANKLFCVVDLVVLGVTRYGDGEAELDEANAGPAASAQAFKRAATAFGLGRYLYDLPTPWEEYDAERRQFSEAAQRRLRTLYLKATAQEGRTDLASPDGDGSDSMDPGEQSAAPVEPSLPPELEAALDVTVPFGAHKDQPLRSLAHDGPGGARYLGWLAGHVQFSSGTFTPRYRRGQELRDAARLVWDSLHPQAREAALDR